MLYLISDAKCLFDSDTRYGLTDGGSLKYIVKLNGKHFKTLKKSLQVVK